GAGGAITGGGIDGNDGIGNCWGIGAFHGGALSPGATTVTGGAVRTGRNPTVKIASATADTKPRITQPGTSR
ncbi:MAG TPA: hypothetical protein VH640_15665, partial [Bryobacteraceae bacterium]